MSKAPTMGEIKRAQQHQELMSKLLEALANPPKPPAPQITLPEPPAPQVIVQPAAERLPTPWTFTFVRNPDGTLQSITATPATYEAAQ